MISLFIAYFLTGKSYIYEKQVNTRVDSPAHRSEFSVPLLERIPVAEAMVSNPITVSPETRISDLVALMGSRKIDVTPVLDSGKLAGIVTTRDIAQVSHDKWSQTTARDVMSKRLLIGYPEENLYNALSKMTKNNISHLPIVDLHSPDRLIGILAIHNITASYDLQKRPSLQ